MSNPGYSWDRFLESKIDSWIDRALGDLFTQRKEKNFPDLPLLAVTGNGGVVPRDSLERRDTSNSDKSKYLRVCPGDITYNTMRMWQGVSGVSKYEGIVSPAYTVCSPKGGVDSSFSSYLVKLPELVQVFHRNSQGLVDDTLNLKFDNFASIKVKLPLLPEQQKIATILTTVDNVIESTQAQINKLQDLKTGMMQELLTRGIGHSEFKDSPVGRIPVGWEVKPLRTMVSLTPGYAFSSTDFTPQGVPLIRMGNLYMNRLDLSRGPVHLPRSFLEKHRKFVVGAGDIVFSMTGTSGKEDYGFAVQIPANTPACMLNQRVAKVEAGDKVNKRFLLHLLHSRHFLDEIYAVGTGTKQANLSSSNILSVDLPFPSLPEQTSIANALDSVVGRLSSLVEKVKSLQSTKKALMQDLLTGKVRVKTD